MMVVAPVLGYFGLPGGVEIVIVAGIFLLLFGKRLPSVMRSLGSSVVEFKKGVNDGDADSNSDNGDASETKKS